MWKKALFMLLTTSVLQVGYLWAGDFDTDEVIVAVLDTGVSGNHELLQDKMVRGFDFVDLDFDSEDTMGHGTHVAGIVSMLAPEAKIMPLRIIEGERIYSPHIAILYAVWNGADIINMSFVAEPYNDLTQKAISYGRSKGVSFIAASGNQCVRDIYYPAKYEGVLSVSAMDPEHYTIFGNYGDDVQYVAPGINVVSADMNGGFVKKSGTSMSAAYISGVLAYIKLKNPNINDKEAEQLLDDASNLIAFQAYDERNIDENEHGLYKAIEINQVKRELSGELALNLSPEL